MHRARAMVCNLGSRPPDARESFLKGSRIDSLYTAVLRLLYLSFAWGSLAYSGLLWWAAVQKRLKTTALKSPRRHPRIRKTAIDPKSLKKRYLNIWKFWVKCKFLIFRERFFRNFPKNSKNSFHASLLAFSKRFFGLGYVWRPQLTKNSNQSESLLFFGEKFGVKKVDEVTWFSDDVIRAWENNARGNFCFWRKLGENPHL